PSPRGCPRLGRPTGRAPRGRSAWSARLGPAGASRAAAGGALGGAGRRLPGAGVVARERLLAGQGDHPYVPAGHHQERRVADLVGRVERRERGLVDREELPVALVHVVGEAAAVALAWEREL